MKYDNEFILWDLENMEVTNFDIDDEEFEEIKKFTSVFKSQDMNSTKKFINIDIVLQEELKKQHSIKEIITLFNHYCIQNFMAKSCSLLFNTVDDHFTASRGDFDMSIDLEGIINFIDVDTYNIIFSQFLHNPSSLIKKLTRPKKHVSRLAKIVNFQEWTAGSNSDMLRHFESFSRMGEYNYSFSNDLMEYWWYLAEILIILLLESAQDVLQQFISFLSEKSLLVLMFKMKI